MYFKDLTTDFLEQTVEPVWITHRAAPSAPARVLWVNKAFSDYFGFSREEIVNEDVTLIHDPDHWDDFLGTVQQAAASGLRSFAAETRCRRKDGGKRWVHIAFFMDPDENGNGRRAVCSLRDIDDLVLREEAATRALSEREHIYDELEALQTRLITAINSIQDPFAIYDMNMRLVIWNSAYAQSSAERPDDIVKGMRIEEVLELAIRNGLYPEARGRVEEWVRQQIGDMEAQQVKSDSIFMLGIGDRQYRIHRNRADNGDFVILRVDITELARQQQKLEDYAQKLEQANAEISYQAQHDELTGLGNRRYLARKLKEFIAQRDAEGGEIAALHIDLDRFKHINDTIGHIAGDRLLQKVADILRDILGKNDVAARIGGDEFVVLMRCRDCCRTPDNIAERIVARCAQPVTIDGRQCRFGASVGIARTPLIDAGELLTSSDVALYRAKSSGRSRAISFDRLDLEKLRQTKDMADDIMRGLEHDEFVPYYQPQIDPRTGLTVGFEALARWHHPEKGVLLPDTFLPTASDMQVDWRIDTAIFEKAITQCSEVFGNGGDIPSLSFNVSVGRIMDDAILDVAPWLASYPGTVAFELLETIFLEEESDAFLIRIDTLRELGLKLEVDDFGSGRASIIALKRLAPDRLKIDRRLIQPIAESESARRLVRSMVEIGQALDIRVTAEGVETAEHVRLLTAFGCDRLQGFFYAKPAPFEEIAAIHTGNWQLPRFA